MNIIIQNERYKMKNANEFRHSKDACENFRDDVVKLLHFLDTNIPDGDDWGTVGSLGYICQQLTEVARFATGADTIEKVVEMLDNFEL